MKLNIGAGHDIYDGWINHDIAALPGIDVVHDLNLTPWPWNDESMDEVVAYDVIEHLDDFIKIMEELWRVMAVGGRAKIRVPYMGSWSFAADPTHRRAFHESTFMFFDPTSSLCQERSYYSHARFTVKTYSYICAPFIPFFEFLNSSPLRNMANRFIEHGSVICSCRISAFIFRVIEQRATD